MNKQPVDLSTMNMNVNLGVYIGARVSEVSRDHVMNFCHEHGIDLTGGGTQYERRLHCTVMYAAKNRFDMHLQEQLLQNVQGQSFKAIPKQWVILTSPNTNKECLALKLECYPLQKFHQELSSKLSLAHSFADYTTHISLHYDFKGELPQQVPEFTIELKDLYVKPLYSETKN